MKAVRDFGSRTAFPMVQYPQCRHSSEKFQKFFQKRSDEHKNSYI